MEAPGRVNRHLPRKGNLVAAIQKRGSGAFLSTHDVGRRKARRGNRDHRSDR